MSGLQPERSREAIEVDLDDRGVLTITLARPDAANSRNQAMRRELAEVYTLLKRRAG